MKFITITATIGRIRISVHINKQINNTIEALTLDVFLLTTIQFDVNLNVIWTQNCGCEEGKSKTGVHINLPVTLSRLSSHPEILENQTPHTH